MSSRAPSLCVVTPYGRAGPSSRVRVYEWLDRLDRSVWVSGYIGHRNASPSYLMKHPDRVLRAEGRLRRMASRRPERLILHREASPLSRQAAERRMLAASGFSIYDIDDALHCDWGEGGTLRRLAPKAPKALASARAADRVIAGSPALADWASEHNPDVVLIPSCVAPAGYRQKLSYAGSDPPRLGWIGSPDNERYLRLIAPALEEVHRRTGARLTLIGTLQPRLGGLERFIDRVAWSERAQAELLAEIDIGLSPMPDEPYTRGKCGYRLLQYAAAGTPLVASPVGVNQELLSRFGMPGPTSTPEWATAILELLEHPAGERERLGQRAHAVVEADYSYDAWLSRWKTAIGIAA